MKKIKYLLGLFIVGIGLLINQSFGLVIEGVTLPLTSSSYSSSSCYKYDFNYSQTTKNGTATPYVRFFGYYSYYNGISQVSYSTQTFRNTSCPQLYKTIQLNNSVFGQDLYTGSCINGGGHSSNLNYGSNMPNLSWGSSFNSLQRVVIGNGQNFGNTFIYVGTLTEPNPSPKYGFGGGFMLNNDWVELNDNTLNSSPLRLFFNQNVNLSSPLDGFDIASNSGDNITGSIAWQYFTQNSAIYRTQYQTSNKYIIDYGREGIKGKHFGGYGMGYSFALNVSSQTNTLQWGNWSFGNIGSRCIESAMNLGITDFDTLTSSACSSLGLLVLKGDTYVSRGNNASVIVLGKNPNNTKQILYEQFDCAEDDLIRIMNPGTGEDNFCNSIGHGYITYNSSSEILPFNSKQDTYTIGSGNAFLDFMFTNGLYGYIGIDSNQYCLRSSTNSDFCFSLVTTPQLTSLKEMYLQNSGDIGGVGGTVTGDMLDDIIINYPTDYYTYSGLVEFAMSGVSLTFDSGYTNNYLSFTTGTGYPILNNLKFGVCPFISDGEFPTIGMSEFSFDIMAPFKCVYYALQVGTRGNNSFPMFTTSLLINDPFFCSGIWIIFIFGIFVIIFKLLKYL